MSTRIYNERHFFCLKDYTKVYYDNLGDLYVKSDDFERLKLEVEHVEQLKKALSSDDNVYAVYNVEGTPGLSIFPLPDGAFNELCLDKLGINAHKLIRKTRINVGPMDFMQKDSMQDCFGEQEYYGIREQEGWEGIYIISNVAGCFVNLPDSDCYDFFNEVEDKIIVKKKFWDDLVAKAKEEDTVYKDDELPF